MRFDQDEGEEENYENGNEDEDMIDDEKMIEIAEHTLVWIAEELVKSGLSLRKIYSQYIVIEQIENTKIELLSPLNFLDGLK